MDPVNDQTQYRRDDGTTVSWDTIVRTATDATVQEARRRQDASEAAVDEGSSSSVDSLARGFGRPIGEEDFVTHEDLIRCLGKYPGLQSAFVSPQAPLPDNARFKCPLSSGMSEWRRTNRLCEENVCHHKNRPMTDQGFRDHLMHATSENFNNNNENYEHELIYFFFRSLALQVRRLHDVPLTKFTKAFTPEIPGQPVQPRVQQPTPPKERRYNRPTQVPYDPTWCQNQTRPPWGVRARPMGLSQEVRLPTWTPTRTSQEEERRPSTSGWTRLRPPSSEDTTQAKRARSDQR